MAKMLLVNPRKRRTTRKSVAKAPATRRRRSRSRSLTTVRATRRRNPIRRMGNTMDTLKNGAIGATGAVVTEAILSKLPLPASLSTGTGMAVSKALVGVGVGMVVSKVMKNRAMGKAMAEGAVTIALHDTIRNAVKGPLGLSGYDSGLLGYDSGLLGYYSAAPVYDSVPDIPNMGYYDDQF